LAQVNHAVCFDLLSGDRAIRVDYLQAWKIRLVELKEQTSQVGGVLGASEHLHGEVEIAIVFDKLTCTPRPSLPGIVNVMLRGQNSAMTTPSTCKAKPCAKWLLKILRRYDRPPVLKERKKS
jgi:hypothetical protein